MMKPLGGVRPIAMRETLYQLTSCTLCFQFREAFATHFSPHQFGVVTKDDCEAIMHDIRYSLNFHLDWVILELDVINTFNLMSKGVIFQKFHGMGGDIVQFIPFVCAFYAFEFPLFYTHHNCEGDVTIIPFAMGTHQGDPGGGGIIYFSPF
jgi:hypothetical protein